MTIILYRDLVKSTSMHQSSKSTTLTLSKQVIVPLNCPDIILAIAPCRSGTTAQLRVFAENGIPSLYQPIKATLRRQMDGEEGLFRIPDVGHVFIKETLGPYTEAESTIDPLAVLLEAGVPQEKIILITMMRDPIDAACSWIERFSFGAERSVLMENLVKAYQTVDRISERAKSIGVETHAFVYESLRDNDPDDVTARLFRRLHLPFSSTSLENWTALPAMGSEESGISFPDEPEKYNYVEGHFLYDKVESSTSLAYHPKSGEELRRHIAKNDILGFKVRGIVEIYDKVRRLCSAELGIQILESVVFREPELYSAAETLSRRR